MALPKNRYLGLAFLSASILCTLNISAPLSLSQTVIAAHEQTSNKIITQEIQVTPETTPKPNTSEKIQKKIAEFRKELKNEFYNLIRRAGKAESVSE